MSDEQYEKQDQLEELLDSLHPLFEEAGARFAVVAVLGDDGEPFYAVYGKAGRLTALGLMVEMQEQVAAVVYGDGGCECGSEEGEVRKAESGLEDDLDSKLKRWRL
jgi:hypothetical protein